MRTSIFAALAIAAGGVVSCVPDPGVAATVVDTPLFCQGITGDDASSLGDSKATLELFATLAPGTLLLGFRDATVSVAAPASVSATSGPTAVQFDLDVGALPASDPVLQISRELLGRSTLDVDVVRASVTASGASAATWVAPASGPISYSTSAPVTLPHQIVTGEIDPGGPGTIAYELDAVRIAIALDSTVAGVQLHTITADCTTDALLPPTLVT